MSQPLSLYSCDEQNVSNVNVSSVTEATQMRLAGIVEGF